MFDFPNVPFIGQKVTGAGGIEYQWDGVKWTAAVTGAAYAPINNPVFTGDPQAPTPATSDSDTTLATTAFVKNVIAASPPPGAIISATAPVGQNPGAMWWDTNGGQLYILYNDGNSTQWVSANNIGLSNVATQADVGKNTGRNLLHNSMFNVLQRGTGPFTSYGHTADRWLLAANLDTVNAAVQALSDSDRAAIGDEAAKWFFAYTFTGNAAAGSYSLLIQNIEDVRRLAGKTVTVSFWAVGTAGRKLGVNLNQAFGTGGSPSQGISTPGQSVALSTSWARYSLTFSIPSISGKTLGSNGDSATQLFFWYSSGSGNATSSGNVGVQSGTINLWGVQLEIGSGATPLEKPDPQVDIANCQRFYQTGFVIQSIGSTAWQNGWGGQHIFPLPVAMRAQPTMAVSNVAQTNCTGTTVTAYSTFGVNHQYVCSGGAGGVASSANYTASADL